MLRSLAQNNPDKAMEFLKGEKITNQNLYEVSPIATSMAIEDPKVAFAWLESLDVQGEARRTLIGNTISAVASDDGSKAASYVLTLDDNSIRKDAISSLVSSWGKQDLESAKTWIDSNLKEGEKLTAYSGLLKGLSNQDPKTATELLVEASQGLTAEEVEKHFGNSMKQIAQGWGRIDPSAATEWLQTQPDNDSRSRAMVSVIGQWADYDSTGAANFVLTLDEGKERDSAVKSLVNAVKHWEPESAFLWANSITDADQRKDQIRKCD